MPTIIKPYGRSPSDGWEWDGKVIKPYGRPPTDGWEWDGQILKPYGRSPNNGWEWDGKALKPYGRSPADGWDWDGKFLKPYGRSPSDGWEWDGRIFKPYGRSFSDGWEVEGAAPIFILALSCKLLANQPSIIKASLDKNVRRADNKNLKSNYKKMSPAEELGARLADCFIDLIEKLILKLINYFKK